MANILSTVSNLYVHVLIKQYLHFSQFGTYKLNKSARKKAFKWYSWYSYVQTNTDKHVTTGLPIDDCCTSANDIMLLVGHL